MLAGGAEEEAMAKEAKALAIKASSNPYRCEYDRRHALGDILST